MTEDKLFTEVYKVSVLIDHGIINPGDAFSEHIHIGEKGLDVFFKNFWVLAEEPDREAKIGALCQELIQEYPAFAFFQHVVGLWLYFDFNAFHYGLKEAALLYALVEAEKGGATLNESALAFIRNSSVAMSKDAQLSQTAYVLIEKFLVEVAPSSPSTSEYKNLFPPVSVVPSALTEALQAKVIEMRMQTGAEYTVGTIAEEIGWYCNVLNEIRSRP